MTKAKSSEFPFEECSTCINRRLDPFACETCDDGSNYEPDEDEEDFEEMSFEDFKNLIFANSLASV